MHQKPSVFALYILLLLLCTTRLACTLSSFDDEPKPWKNTIQSFEDGFGIHQDDSSFRTKRSTPVSNVNKIKLKVNKLNDTHQQLIVHWVGDGSSIIICLAKDGRTSDFKGRTKQNSLVFYSYDYGDTFQSKTSEFLSNQSTNFSLQLDKFYIHSKFSSRTIFSDSSNKMIFLTDNDGKTFRQKRLPFTPSEISFHPTSPDIFLVHDKSDPKKKLHLTVDYGRSFKLLQDYVKTFEWFSEDGIEKRNIIIQRDELKGKTNALKLTWTQLVFGEYRLDPIMISVIDLYVKGEYIFATKNSSSLNEDKDLFIKYRTNSLVKTIFPTKLARREYHIADITEQRVIMAVYHSENVSNLYVSDVISENGTEIRFSLAMENIFCYFPNKSWTTFTNVLSETPFVDLHRIEGLRGIYIASQILPDKYDSTTKPGLIPLNRLVTRITYNWGISWFPLNLTNPQSSNYNCQMNDSCSLHLSQKYGYISAAIKTTPILSSKSAPGLIIAAGVYGKNMLGHVSIFISHDAGVTWFESIKENSFFNIGDHGSMIVALKQNQRVDETIMFSTDMGLTWQYREMRDVHIRVYSLMTEPGENTTIFSFFGSLSTNHSWVIVKADFTDEYDSNCTDIDFKPWIPHNPVERKMNCLMGRKEVFKQKRHMSNCRIGNTNLFVEAHLCSCDKYDYMCDDGFVLSNETNHCVRNKSVKTDPYTIPKSCTPGDFFYRTKGYKKIPDDVCINEPREYKYDKIPCPINDVKEFLLLSQKDKISMFNLDDPKQQILPIDGLNNVIAVEYDIHSNCLFYADIIGDIINEWCLSGTKTRNIINKRLKSVEGLAYDWVSKHLYVVDGARSIIEVVRVDVVDTNRFRKTIINNTIAQKPRGIALSPVAGYMFWTDWGSLNQSINRANLDGSNYKELFSSGQVEWPNGITIDHIADRIYWVDAKLDYIGMSDFDGKGFKRVIFKEPELVHPFSVAVFRDNLYWDDWRETAIFMADKDFGYGISRIAHDLQGLMDMKLFAHSIQEGVNGCSNNSCSHMCFGLPNNNVVCGCPDDLVLSGNKCVCPGGIEPANKTVCWFNETTCSRDEFRCHNGDGCVPLSAKCNKEKDCLDNSDEMDCANATELTTSCGANMHRCGNGKCIIGSWKCDHDYDCSDHSDELNCSYPTCGKDKFTCNNGRCIPQAWKCDRENDCRDGSDEEKCDNGTTFSIPTTTCRGDEMNCSPTLNEKTALCIPLSWRCDGDRDCPNGADEMSCGEQPCLPDHFKCDGTKCIQDLWRCDGDLDCIDGSDEKNCSTMLPPIDDLIPNTTCYEQTKYTFMCFDEKMCIPLAWKCDNVTDCSDASDELGCWVDETEDVTTSIIQTDVPRPNCDENEFSCVGRCIPHAYICDKVPDCEDRSDEAHCNGMTLCKTDGSQFQCRRSGECISVKKLCNGEVDCIDHSDEGVCSKNGTILNEPVNCAEGYFKCDERCLELYQKCDGRVNCMNGLDEQKCTPQSKNYQATEITIDLSNDDFAFVSWKVVPRALVSVLYIPSIMDTTDKIWQNSSATTFTYFIFNKLKPDRSYNMTVYVENPDTNVITPPFEYLLFKPTSGVPNAPVDVNVKILNTTYTTTSFQVHWSVQSSEDTTNYEFFIEMMPPSPAILWKVKGTERTATLNFALQNNIEYSITVRAKNILGISPPSKPSNFVFTKKQSVAGFNDLRADRPTAHSITLSWTPTSPDLTYQVIAYSIIDSNRKHIRTKDHQITMTDLLSDTEYTFTVRVMDKNAMPVSVKATTLSENTSLPLVSNVTATSVDGNCVLVSWLPPTNYTGKLLYLVYYGTGTDHYLNVPKANTINTSITFYYGENLKPCNEYLFDVATSSGGEIGRSSGSPAHYLTENDEKAPPKNFDIHLSPNHSTNIAVVSWNSSCPHIIRPVNYTVSIVASNKNETHTKNIIQSKRISDSYKFIVKIGGVYNVSVYIPNQKAPIVWKHIVTQHIPGPTEVLCQYNESTRKFILRWNTDVYDNYYKGVHISYDVITSVNNSRTKYTTDKAPYSFSLNNFSYKQHEVLVRAVFSDGRTSPYSNAILTWNWDLTNELDNSVESKSVMNESATSNDTSYGWLIFMVILVVCSAAGVVYWRKRQMSQRNFGNLANSHYNIRSGSTTFSGVNGLDMDDGIDLQQDRFSDDEPLVVN